MSYADFINKSALIFISHSKFLKIVEDTGIKVH
jgi:hypothetical protein